MKFEALMRGTSFRPIEAKAFVLAMKEGHILSLQRESDNQYDSNAIQVIDPESQIFIGFVAKEMAQEIAPLMDEGVEFNCRAGTRMDSKFSFALDIWSTDEGPFPTEEPSALIADNLDDEIPF